MENIKLRYCGALPLLEEEPCFATPVFSGKDNTLWIQDANALGIILRFVKISNEHAGKIQKSDEAIELSLGDQEISAFWDGAKLAILKSAEDKHELAVRLVASNDTPENLKNTARFIISDDTQSPDSIESQDEPSPDEIDLGTWLSNSLGRWREKIETLPIDDWRRLQSGYWHVAYKIDPFEETSLRDLKAFLDEVQPKYSGWPPFTFLHGEGTPRPMGSSIEAWIGEKKGTSNPDFWRVSTSGEAFLLRPMQEDSEDYGSRISPTLSKPAFDWVFPIWRMFEVYQHLYSMATWFASDQSKYKIKVSYVGTSGRMLQTHNLTKYYMEEYGPSEANELQSEASGYVFDLEENIERQIMNLLAPIYEQFSFAELPPLLISNVISEAKKNKRR